MRRLSPNGPRSSTGPLPLVAGSRDACATSRICRRCCRCTRFFALAVPLVVPLAANRPVLVLFGSLFIWLFASQLGPLLPSAYDEGWSFNPFAWQLMFMSGVLARIQPISAEFHASATARWLTRIAVGVVLGFAFAKLFIEIAPPPGYMKQNLATLRIVSFGAVIAWVFARAVHAGWIGALARSLPGVVTIGTQGLVCFIAGTACRSCSIPRCACFRSGHFAWLAGLAADAARDRQPAAGSRASGVIGRTCGACRPSRRSRCPRMRQRTAR